jgi:hypothetical protein
MRTPLATTSLVETVVTLSAAALMTIAGLVMFDDTVPSTAGAATVAARAPASGPAG